MRLLFGNSLFRAASIHNTASSFSRRILVGGSLLASAYLLYNQPISSDSNVKEALDSISVDKNVDPIPNRIQLTTGYEILGYGTRSVTFLGFRVYALGLYVASKDLYKIPTVLDSKFLSQAFIDTDDTKSHQENVLIALKDQSKSKILVSNLLDSNIRLVARITPIRNTDFNHLRDGLIKSILAAKIKDETLDEGLQELKNAFLRKGSAPKNHNLILERLEDGKLKLYYENTTKNESFILGTVNQPIISKTLFLQYLSGGLSPGARETSIARISQLV